MFYLMLIGIEPVTLPPEEEETRHHVEIDKENLKG